MEFSRVPSCIVALICVAFLVGKTSLAQAPKDVQKVTITTIEPQAVTVTDRYLCKIHGQRHIRVRALDKGFVKTIAVKEGQKVKEGDLLFEISPINDQEQKDANAKAALVKAPFGGIVGRMEQGEGGLVLEGEVLTILSDNSNVWVYFSVPETRYLTFMAQYMKKNEHPNLELVLANGKKFDQPGKLGAIEAQFNPETKSIPFRADFPNPERLLRHGQGGTISMSQLLTDAIVVPQQATFEQADKRYVYVVDKANVVHQREIFVQNELEKQFVIQSSIAAGDRIVLEGIPQLHDGDKVECIDR